MPLQLFRVAAVDTERLGAQKATSWEVERESLTSQLEKKDAIVRAEFQSREQELQVRSKLPAFHSFQTRLPRGSSD